MRPLPKYIQAFVIVTTLLSTIGAFAQTENKYKSRLDIKPKQKTTTSVSSLRKSTFSYFQPYHNALDRGINVQRATAINQYFASSLLQYNNNKNTNKPEVAITANSMVENSRVEEFINIEDKLFTSDKLWVSNIYPNPADEHADVEYSISSQVSEVKITFYNILGSEIKESFLEKDQRRARISTKEWPNGIYLYQLTADGKSLVTKKLLVRHQ